MDPFTRRGFVKHVSVTSFLIGVGMATDAQVLQ